MALKAWEVILILFGQKLNLSLIVRCRLINCYVSPSFDLAGDMLELALEFLNPEAKMIHTKIRWLSTRKLLKTGILYKACPERGTVSIMPLSRTSLASLRQNSFISENLWVLSILYRDCTIIFITTSIIKEKIK